MSSIFFNVDVWDKETDGIYSLFQVLGFQTIENYEFNLVVSLFISS
jgi:hypothetical protein